MIKKLIYILTAIALCAIVAYRVVQISNENSREIFNIARIAQIDGMPVEIMVAETKTDMLREPIVVKNGKAFVSGARVHKFKLGQRLVHADDSINHAAGRIISVSRNIDLDTGLFAVKTSSPDGNFFAEIEYTGIFVPLSAISDYKIMVSESGVAVEKPVHIIAADADNAVVSGLSDGDSIILTKIESGTKIKTLQQ